MYNNYNNIKYKLNTKQEFKGSSTEAFIKDNNYIVKSYDTVILKLSNNNLMLDNQYYSNTTSIIQNMILNEISINHNNLIDYLKNYFKEKNLSRSIYTVNF